MVSKFVKEIIIAAKSGANPDGNPRLRAAIEAAKKGSVTRDTLERAIKKGSGQLDDGVVLETITYEGFAPHQVPVIVECLTDNRNRTAADIRGAFRKGQLGSNGSVAWMFKRAGIVEGLFPKTGIDLEGLAIEAGAQDVRPLQGSDVPAGQTGATFETNVEDLVKVSQALTAMGWTLSVSELSWVAKELVEVGDAQRIEVVDFLNELDDHDDVHRVYTALA